MSTVHKVSKIIYFQILVSVPALITTVLIIFAVIVLNNYCIYNNICSANTLMDVATLFGFLIVGIILTTNLVYVLNHGHKLKKFEKALHFIIPLVLCMIIGLIFLVLLILNQ